MDKRTFNLMWLGSGTGSRYWLLSLDGDGTDIVNDLAIDSLNNIYIIGYTNGVGSGSNDIFLAKISDKGLLQWQIVLGNSSSNQGNGIAIDASDNIYITCDSESNMYVAKYNTSGILQWQRSLDGSSTESGHKIVTDSSGNVYIIGTTNSKGAGGIDMLLAKYNSSGTLQWQRAYGGTGSEVGNHITIDASSNIYFTGSTDTIRSGTVDLVLVKYTATGTITWQRSLGGKEYPVGHATITDSVGNVYVSGVSNTAPLRNILIAKYNSSGTIQWQKTIQGTEANQNYKIGIDSSNNIYVLSIKDDDNKMYMAKLNSSGSFIWQRSIGNGVLDSIGGIQLNALDDIIIVWSAYIPPSYTSYGIYIAKLPNNGSKLGTYGDVVYANVTLNMVSNTFFSNTITLTNNTAINLTDNTSVSLTQMDANLTSNLIKI